MVSSNFKNGVIIYGTGGNATAITEIIEANNIFIKFYCVGHKKYLTKNEFRGKKVYILDDVPSEERVNLPIFISNYSPNFSIKDIKNDIQKKGFKNIFDLYDLVRIFNVENTFYWLTNHPYEQANEAKVKEVRNLLRDDLSKSIFDSTVDCRLKKDFSKLKENLSTPKEQYLPENLKEFILDKDLYFLDAGAYIGDSYDFFKSQGAIINKYIGLEPDPKNYEKLVQLVKNEKSPIETLLLPCGLWSKTTQLRFNCQDISAGSSIGNTGDILIQCLSIDEFIKDSKINLIKMDIEGAEIDAIKGGIHTIKNCKPMLMISLYHKPEDLIEIPLLLNEICKEYNFFIRYHAYNGFDIVLYAFPKQ